MFLILQTTIEIILLIAGLLIFTIVSWRNLTWGAALVLLAAPLYLLKIKIGWLPLTVLELMIGASFIIWFIKNGREWFKKEGESKFDSLWLMPILLILIGTILAAAFSVDIRTSAGILKGWFLAPIVFGLVLLEAVKTKEQLKAILWAAVLSASTVAVISLGYLFAGQLTFDGRLKAFYLSPNHLTMYLVPGFLLAIWLWFEAKKSWQKFLLITYYLLLITALYFTYSYAAWLGILAAAIFLLIEFYRRRVISRKILYLVSCILVIAFILVIFFQFNTEKLNNLLYSGRSSWQSRLMVWRASWEILKDHWFLGIGPGLFQKYYLEYQKYFPPYLEWAVPQPHNLFLAFWLQTGLVGLVGFIWLLTVFFIQLTRLIVIPRPPHQNKFGAGQAPAEESPANAGRGSSHTREILRFAQDDKSKDWQKTKQPLILILIAVMIYILVHGLLDTTYWKNDLALIFWTIIFLGYKAGRLCG